MHHAIIKNLIKPKRLEFESLTPQYGKFVVEPLERGYGLTIGNSLRRILLSSLPGAAIVAARIDSVKHEFSTVSGCVEDVTEIVLNLKEVVLQMHETDRVELRIDVKGPCEVTAGMFEVGPNVTIVNPESHIATLNEEGRLKLECTALQGRGYVTSESQDQEGLPVGTVTMDAAFSPIRKVNHYVTNARVGQRTDYDKLTVEVWTNGSLSPEEAIKGASYILKDQFSVFAGVEEVVDVVEKKVEEVAPKWNENLFRRIDELELSVRSSNCLENANIKYIGELVQRTEAEMLRTKNFGRKSLNEIKEILGEMGLSLGMKMDGFLSREELDKAAEESGVVFS